MNYFDQQSERLIYRKLTGADIPAWTEFFVNNDRLAYLGIDTAKTKETLAEEWITLQFKRYKEQGLGHLAVQLKDTGEFIGMGGILPRELEGNNEYEIAYSLLPEFWGQGYGTEIATTLRDFGFKNIATGRFISIIHVDNQQSANVARKNGMDVIFRTRYLGMDVEVYGIAKPVSVNN